MPTTQLYQYFSVFSLFVLLSDEPEVFLPKYFQTAILHAAHFRRVVNQWRVCRDCQNTTAGISLRLLSLSVSMQYHISVNSAVQKCVNEERVEMQ